MTIELPWPPRQLFPNFKRSHHWTAYSGKAKSARTLAWGLTAREIGTDLRKWPVPADGKLPVRIEATPPMRGGRVPDDDNLKGACKHYLDGLADALGIDDSKFRLAELEWRPKSGDGAIRITF